VGPRLIFEAPAFNFPQRREVEAASHALVIHGTGTAIAIVTERHALLHSHTEPEMTIDQTGNDEIVILELRTEEVRQRETAGLMQPREIAPLLRYEPGEIRGRAFHQPMVANPTMHPLTTHLRPEAL